MAERDFAADFSRYWRDRGAIVTSYVAGQYGMTGFPDKIVIHARWQGLIELKGVKTPFGPKQRHTLRELARRWPGHVWMLRDLGVDDRCEIWDPITRQTTRLYLVDLLNFLTMREQTTGGY